MNYRTISSNNSAYGDYKVFLPSKNGRVVIEFNNTGTRIEANRAAAMAGSVRDRNVREFFGVGYLGYGEACFSFNKAMYTTWYDMLSRCYDHKREDVSSIRYRHRGVRVDTRWHCLQDFMPWFLENHVSGWHLDKDLTSPGCNLYSPETCSFVPPEVNCLLVSCNTRRGDLPVGVSREPEGEGFRTILSSGAGRGLHYRGGFNSPDEAFRHYKNVKTNVIMEVANRHREAGNISDNVYNTLMSWEINKYPN